MSKKPLSTFEKEMLDPVFKQEFDVAYRDFLLSELIVALMEDNNKSVRMLAKEVGLSPAVIQNMRSGKQEDIKLSNFINISHACGYHVVLERGKERISLS